MLILLVAGYSYGQTFQPISGTAHDFQLETFTTEICNVCHTPHGDGTVVDTGPLWNRTATLTAAFTMYPSGAGTTIDGTIDAAPNAGSKLCLGCHDGTVAVDNFGGTASATPNQFISATTFLGTNGESRLVGSGGDLSDSHPISITYTTTTASSDGELVDPSLAGSGLTGAASTIDGDMLFNGKVECASCHDVHGGVAGTKLLLTSNAASGLCLTCHAK